MMRPIKMTDLTYESEGISVGFDLFEVYDLCGIEIVLLADRVVCHIWATDGELLTGECGDVGKTVEEQVNIAVVRLLAKLLDKEPVLLYKVYDELTAIK